MTTIILLALEFWTSSAALTWFSLLCTQSSWLQSKGENRFRAKWCRGGCVSRKPRWRNFGL